MTEIVAADIGGTHARFALATIEGPRVVALGKAVTLPTADHASLQSAWRAFADTAGRPLPRRAAIALATPIQGELLQLTNNPWAIRTAEIADQLGLDSHNLVNDFGAIAHAVTQVSPDHLRPLAGPDGPLPTDGAISIVGPGTGLGVALLLHRDGRDVVVETEGGHIDFAPVDAFDDALLEHLRARHGRVSVERVVSGPGLAAIHETLGGAPCPDHKALWTLALSGSESLAAAALDRLALNLGSIAGDIALAHGAAAVVIAGGLGLRLADRLPVARFVQRFTAKGRFAGRMAAIPVRLLTHPQPGLLGAAAAYAATFGSEANSA